MFQEGDLVRVIKDVNEELPAGSVAEILAIHHSEYPFELLGSCTCFAGNELELAAS